jgi:hypothetical protein
MEKTGKLQSEENSIKKAMEKRWRGCQGKLAFGCRQKQNIGK